MAMVWSACALCHSIIDGSSSQLAVWPIPARPVLPWTSVLVARIVKAASASAHRVVVCKVSHASHWLVSRVGLYTRLLCKTSLLQWDLAFHALMQNDAAEDQGASMEVLCASYHGYLQI